MDEEGLAGLPEEKLDVVDLSHDGDSQYTLRASYGCTILIISISLLV